MKWIKYLLSGAAILLVTVLVMLLPNAYQQYTDQQGPPSGAREILLEQTIQKPTASEMLRLIMDSVYQSGNYVAVEVMGDKLVTGADGHTADCRQILGDVFGKKEESKVTALMLERLERGKDIQIRTYKLVMLSGSDVVTTNIVEAKYDDLSIYYEEDHKLALHISLYGSKLDIGSVSDTNTEAETLFSSVQEQASAVEAYYHALGLKDGEFIIIVGNGEYEQYFSVVLTPESYEDTKG